MHPEFTFQDLLTNSLEQSPDKPAVVDGSDSHTYADLDRKSDALAAALLDGGIRRGQRVGVYMEKSWEAIVAMLAASKAGAAFVNINPLLKAQQVAYIAGDCDVRALIGESDRLATLDAGLVKTAFHKGGEAPPVADESHELTGVLESGEEPTGAPRVQENDLSSIIYTSGSTGMPKGVALSHRNLVAGAQIVSTYLENTPEDRILSALPLNFDAGLNQFTTSLRVGATLVLQHSRLPGDLLKSLRGHEITGLAGVPPLWPLLIRNRKSLEEEPPEHLRYISNTGGRIPNSQLEELRRLLPSTDIYLMYGLTEAFRSTYVPPAEVERGLEGCIGKAIPDTDVWVVTEDNREAEDHEVGELVHRGPTVALGYWGKEDATRERFKPSPFTPEEIVDKERVVYSGDLVKRDEDGFLYFVGRNDAMIKVQGYRLSPEEVENLLVATGEVSEACAFGLPDESTGERVVAVVSFKYNADNGDVEHLREYCVANAPQYMIPRQILVHDGELPKGPSGKIDRPKIKETYSG
ncbi:acyl-CoA ligase (AMP-forming), exosortase A system-associated [Rubrobacter aplysinae]|uniref:acyl-CoA ligase (AMP-forming), exosortase A system-associated n=1 Tax=Rubrobacter aplysinae TaxID=909625 RepID=UPI00064C431D|nr:acyl-CoA ligase (AMP-forming), exosortase A system-associated [Rubrobacter aplysinae]